MSNPRHNPLTKYEENICIWGGVFGALLTATCLIQHMAAAIFFWVTWMMLFFYLVNLVSYILVATQHVAGPVMIIISAAMALANELIFQHYHAFSVVVLLLALYGVVLAVFLYNERIPARLMEKYRMKKKEEADWYGKI